VSFPEGFSTQTDRICEEGVKDVKTSLEEQSIKVDFDAGQVKKEDMLAALKKWGDSGNKSVALVA
jgi:copper chaperone CopZ